MYEDDNNRNLHLFNFIYTIQCERGYITVFTAYKTTEDDSTCGQYIVDGYRLDGVCA